MSDPMTGKPPEPTRPPAPTTPVAPAANDENVGRYDANVQLILRRLADSDRHRKPRWWWQSH
jgi:hypothetical protein